MKNIVLLIAIVAAGCTNTPIDRVRSFIPGTYVKSINSEYSSGNDTLMIEVISKEGNNYLIKRHAGYQKIKNQKFQSIENKSEVWIGIYNENEKVLHETRYGKLISFDPTNEKLYVGNSSYSKIN